MLKPLNSALEPNLDEPLQLSIDLDRRKPVSDQIYTTLRQAIITLELPPSTPISENRICRHIGVSRTPVREAIIRLAEEELIDVFPQQGSFVSAIKVGKIRESHFTRKCLELGILGKLAEQWTSELSVDARKLLTRQEQALILGDKELFHFQDEEFHKFFSQAVGYRGVWNTIQGAKARVDRLHRLAAIEGRLPIVIEEHRAILDALDRQDLSGASDAMDYHLDRILALLDLIIDHNKEYFAE